MAKEKIGQKLYKFVGDKLYQCRLIKVKNDNCFVVKTEDGSKVNLTKAQYSQYTKLREDGIVVLSTVELQDNVPDVIVSMFRQSDLAKGIPYCVCRNNIFDVFSNTIENDGGNMYIGCSISQDTCPENIDFLMLIGCNKMEYSEMLAIYYDDTLDDWMEMINKIDKFNYVLSVLKEGFDAHTRGAVDSLRKLLEDNHFIDDVRRGFNIVTVNFKYEKKFEVEFTRAVEDIIKREMIAPVWVPFTREIDLKKISDKYILVIDSNNDMYVVSYVEGEYCNRPYLAMGDTTEVEAMRNLVQ